jgi:hypothetical protein
MKQFLQVSLTSLPGQLHKDPPCFRLANAEPFFGASAAEKEASPSAVPKRLAVISSFLPKRRQDVGRIWRVAKWISLPDS